MSKALADHLGYAIFFGTPKGKNEFHRIYQAALTDAEWTVVFKTIEDSLRDEEGETIQNLRQALEDDKKLIAQGLMTQDEFNQEWYCSFEAAIKGAYYATQLAEVRKQGRIKLVPYDPALKVHMVSDLGVGPNFATGFYQKVAGELRMIDYWEGSNTDGIPEAVKAAKDKPYVYGKWFLPHDAEAHSIDTGKTRVQTIKELWPNIDIVIIPRLSVDDGISRGRLMFSHLWINETTCQKFLDYIAQYRQKWNEEKGMFEEKPLHDFTSHAADVHRGAAVIEDQMTNEDDQQLPDEEEANSDIYDD